MAHQHLGVDTVTNRHLAVLGAPPAFSEPLHVGRPNVGDRERFLARFNEMLGPPLVHQRRPAGQGIRAEASPTYVGVKHCVAMCNATIALEIAIRALGLTGRGHRALATPSSPRRTPCSGRRSPRSSPTSIRARTTSTRRRSSGSSRRARPASSASTSGAAPATSTALEAIAPAERTAAHVRRRPRLWLLARRPHDRRVRSLRGLQLPRHQVPQQLRGRRGRHQRRRPGRRRCG